DDELRREVESLLANQRTNDSFIGRLALDEMVQGLAQDTQGSWIGRKIGSHQIVSLLGAGGMGEVYRARDTKLKLDVAIKVLPDHLLHNPGRASRFHREAEMLDALNHSGIAAIYGVEEANGVRCLVLEMVEGETLQERLQRGRIPIEESLQIAK